MTLAELAANCTHDTTDERWVPDSEDEQGHWVSVYLSLCVDIDTHRYRCTRCNTVMYYSGAAKAYFEGEVKSDIPGLGG
jgi:hypothetical protein